MTILQVQNGYPTVNVLCAVRVHSVKCTYVSMVVPPMGRHWSVHNTKVCVCVYNSRPGTYGVCWVWASLLKHTQSLLACSHLWTNDPMGHDEWKETEILFSLAWHWWIQHPLSSVFTLCLPGKKESLMSFRDAHCLCWWIIRCCSCSFDLESHLCLQTLRKSVHWKTAAWTVKHRPRGDYPQPVFISSGASVINISLQFAITTLNREHYSVSPHLDWHPHMACLSGVSGSAHDLPGQLIRPGEKLVMGCLK